MSAPFFPKSHKNNEIQPNARYTFLHRGYQEVKLAVLCKFQCPWQQYNCRMNGVNFSKAHQALFYLSSRRRRFMLSLSCCLIFLFVCFFKSSFPTFVMLSKRKHKLTVSKTQAGVTGRQKQSQFARVVVVSFNTQTESSIFNRRVFM